MRRRKSYQRADWTYRRVVVFALVSAAVAWAIGWFLIASTGAAAW